MRNQASPGSNTSRSSLFSDRPGVGVALEARRRLRGGRDPADRLAGLVGGAADAEAVGVAQPARRARRRTARSPAGSGARGTAGRGRSRRACPRRCRARSCLRSRRRTPGCAGWRSAAWNASQTSAARPLPQAEPQPCAALARVRRRVDADSGRARRCTGTACSRSATMSSQNRLAENFSRITTEPPPTSSAPVATTPPTLWYIGRQSYSRSSGRCPSGRRTSGSTHQPVMADVGGLGQAGGAGGVDQQRAVGEGDGRRSAAVSGAVAKARRSARSMRPKSSCALAVRPELRRGFADAAARRASVGAARRRR